MEYGMRSRLGTHHYGAVRTRDRKTYVDPGEFFDFAVDAITLVLHGLENDAEHTVRTPASESRSDIPSVVLDPDGGGFNSPFNANLRLEALFCHLIVALEAIYGHIAHDVRPGTGLRIDRMAPLFEFNYAFFFTVVLEQSISEWQQVSSSTMNGDTKAAQAAIMQRTAVKVLHQLWEQKVWYSTNEIPMAGARDDVDLFSIADPQRFDVFSKITLYRHIRIAIPVSLRSSNPTADIVARYSSNVT
ncbi:hypothetical protein G7Y89_g5486 [Cudoniella acicularis]|uniref:Uncharacterized protein n=1 Tax=Cudoniella acicularis TaxID=354080 RepID=A0A8H4RMD8_9HELO|nr:hypothetical protein G7Y89_g5486 [Cudoniella acicularis]